MKSIVSIGFAVAVLVSATTQASGINGINQGMPNRISMNVTVPKQTQGATFGEKVNAGLHAAGSVVASGAGAIIIECGRDACAFAFPDGSGYRADTRRMTFQLLAPAQAAALRRGPVAEGASLLGGALPGGAVISAAVSSVGNLAGSGGGAAAASYARTGRASEGGKEGLATASMTPGMIDVLDPLTDGDYTLTLVVEKAIGGVKDTMQTQVRTAAPPRLQIVVAFTVKGGVLKARHDMAKNSVRNLR